MKDEPYTTCPECEAEIKEMLFNEVEKILEHEAKLQHEQFCANEAAVLRKCNRLIKKLKE